MNGSFFQNFPKFEPNWKNRVMLLTIWPKIGPIGLWMSNFFLKNWYLYGSTFKFCGSMSLPKPNLSTPLGCEHADSIMHSGTLFPTSDRKNISPAQLETDWPTHELNFYSKYGRHISWGSIYWVVEAWEWKSIRYVILTGNTPGWTSVSWGLWGFCIATTLDRSDITFYPEGEICWTNKICGLEKQTSLFKLSWC